MRLRFAIPLMLVPFSAEAQPAPDLKALQGFAPGAWQVTAIGGQSSSSQCLQDSAALLMGGRPGAQCSFSIIADSADSGTVTYRCSSGRSGRTSIRRDAKGIFTVDAQGLENGHPFQDRSEWRRSGGC
ncbi:hypothetical protein FJQ54_07860 [Sandaracinobacter neustonicus]|uniref:DUF3617 family protein n=1 Tax=Sandaracinobacter neustonicus TaxID=1715348 RepID=A0A501XM86_9SPHN|nr:hypothetical protein [Sandaracinobacter neustonicus]TPE61802.1 hypothetical protein FJQ54_07860 [Sandaracinobacter neustonicus]